VRGIHDGRPPATKSGRGYRIPHEAIEPRIQCAHPGTRVIAVATQKGGVSKTTTSLNLAAGLAQHRQRVLLVDLDPQGGCAVSLGIATDSLNRTVYNVLMSDEVGFPHVTMQTRHGFHLAPSNIDLAGAEIELKQLLAAEQVLRRNLDEMRESYDFILLDCPPSLGMLTINALTAADELLIPMSMELLALRGLDMLAKTVTKIRSVTNPQLSYLGILATKYDRRPLHRREVFEALQAASREAGIYMFNTYIVNSVRFTESPSAGVPLVLSDPEHPGSKAYMAVVEKIIYG